jgi:hypothetical protein
MQFLILRARSGIGTSSRQLGSYGQKSRVLINAVTGKVGTATKMSGNSTYPEFTLPRVLFFAGFGGRNS